MLFPSCDECFDDLISLMIELDYLVAMTLQGLFGNKKLVGFYVIVDIFFQGVIYQKLRKLASRRGSSSLHSSTPLEFWSGSVASL